MDKFPLHWQGKSIGELTAEREGLYTRYTAVCCLPERKVWCVWAIGESGELRLGVPEPTGTEARICRRFSPRMTEPLGRILRGELRPAAERTEAPWENVSAPETLFRTPWLQHRLKGCCGVLQRRSESRFAVAIPWDSKKPFLLTPLMCFPAVRVIGTEYYSVFFFDSREQPLFP